MNNNIQIRFGFAITPTHYEIVATKDYKYNSDLSALGTEIALDYLYFKQTVDKYGYATFLGVPNILEQETLQKHIDSFLDIEVDRSNWEDMTGKIRSILDPTAVF